MNTQSYININFKDEKYDEEKSFTQDIIKQNIDIDMISLHDYSKSKEDDQKSMPTLLNDRNQLAGQEFEIVCIQPQEITIFQVLYTIIMYKIFIFHK